MQIHSDYKDSGYEEIGHIPELWRVVKLRNIGKFTSSGIDKTINENEELVRIINYTDVYGNPNFELKEKDYMVVSASKEKIKQHQVCVGDLIFTPSSETIEDIGISALVVENLPNTAFSYHVLRFQFEENINLPFRKYLCNNYLVQNYYSSMAKGSIRKTLSMSDFKETLVIIPKYSEQQDIARYLDVKTEQIDTLISKLQIQAEMLEAYKRELIAEVVTKGLNKEASLKNSGIDWIGNVPEHWGIVPLMAVAKENKTKNEGMKCNNLLSLSYGNIIRKDIDTNFGLLPESFEGYQVVHEGYMILRMTDLQNDKRSLRTGYATETGIITSAYIGLEPSEIINSRYFSYLLHAYDLIKVYYSLGAGLRQSLRFNDVKRLPVLLPSKEEQKEIVSFLDEKTGKIHEVVSDITNQIEKLKDYRKILIHEAVTGKIKITEG